MRSLIALSAVLAIGLATPPASAQAPKPVLKDFGVDWMKGTRPRDPYADQKGRVWFVGQTGNYIGRIEPSTGEVTRFEIDAGTGPHNLVVDPKGTVWFTGNRNNRLVKMDPETGKLTTYMIPDSTVRDPHTMIWDSKGQYAWFTAQNSNVVGRFTAATGEFKLWRTGTRSRPYGIVIDSKGMPWFDLFGTNKIGTITPALELKEFELPDPASRPRRIAITSDGGVWYGDYARGYLGRLDPATGKTEEYALPSGAKSLPYGMTVDDRDRVWVVETGVQPNKLVSFDAKKRVFEDQIAVGGTMQQANTVRHMMFDPATKTIWFGQDIGLIGSLKLPTVVVP